MSQFLNFGGGGFPIYNGLEGRNVSNFTWSHTTGSIRYVGTLDMSIPAIWLYSEFFFWMYPGNYGEIREERIVTTPAANDFDFVPLSLVTTGYTNWTLFTGKNFDGVSTCLVSLREIEMFRDLKTAANSTLSKIGSVVRGCAGTVDRYVYGGETNEPIIESPIFSP